MPPGLGVVSSVAIGSRGGEKLSGAVGKARAGSIITAVVAVADDGRKGVADSCMGAGDSIPSGWARAEDGALRPICQMIPAANRHEIPNSMARIISMGFVLKDMFLLLYFSGAANQHFAIVDRISEMFCEG